MVGGVSAWLEGLSCARRRVCWAGSGGGGSVWFGAGGEGEGSGSGLGAVGGEVAGGGAGVARLRRLGDRVVPSGVREGLGTVVGVVVRGVGGGLVVASAKESWCFLWRDGGAFGLVRLGLRAGNSSVLLGLKVAGGGGWSGSFLLGLRSVGPVSPGRRVAGAAGLGEVALPGLGVTEARSRQDAFVRGIIAAAGGRRWNYHGPPSSPIVQASVAAVR